MTPKFEIKSALPSATNPVAQSADVLAVYQDPSQKAMLPKSGPYLEALTRSRKSETFSAKSGSVQFLRYAGEGSSENALFVGVGVPGAADEEQFRQAGGHAFARLHAEKVTFARVWVSSFVEIKGLKSERSQVKLLRAFAEGLVLGAYEYNRHKTGAAAKKKTAPLKIEWIVTDASLRTELKRELDQVAAVAEAVQVTRDWSNEPSNYGTPEFFADEAVKLAKKYGLKVRVLTEKDAAREKMGLYLGVGQGSEKEGRIVVLEHAPTNAKKKVALVGKGITFDSGGISIKPSLRMEDMKHDMTGAATVMGAMILSKLWGCTNHVVGIMAFTENMPDGNSINPGNVLVSRSGKTVEVINTDAEGRLILGDALDFAQDFKPDAIIDIATLTGAVSVALGKYACAVLGNDSSLVDAVRKAGERNGERIWELPLWDDYFDDMKSDTADMRNSANDGNGGTIRGAIFLKQFIKKGQAWAHLDIAGTAYGLTHLPYIPKKGASGLWVRTLAQLATDY